jgi:hypothetical protein
MGYTFGSFLHSMLIKSRDPWWVFTTISLFYTIKREYNFGLWELVFISPRFGVMLASMCLSIAFIVVDTCSVLNAFSDSLPQGIEPFWKVLSTSISPKIDTFFSYISPYTLRSLPRCQY